MKQNSKIITIKDFHATKLNNDRDIHVYLPPGYESNLNERYPVLYMHDGQYAFEVSQNTGGSWDAHKVADRLISEGRIKGIIIVAIPNMGSERGSEYAHEGISFIKNLNLKSSGLSYEDFIINDLKPYIDSNFRTLSDSQNTALIGSSMGGLVTYNIGFRNPHIFGKLAILSPYFVSMDAETLKESNNYTMYKGKKPLKIWMDIGEVEGFILARHVRNVVNDLIKEGYEPGKDLVYYYVPDGAHFEKDWAERIHAPLLYFFGDIGKMQSVQLYGRDTVGLKGMKIQANPVVKYDSGFVMSDIDGEYIVDDSDILEVMPDGTIVPKKEGKTKVTYIKDGIKASKEYTVIRELSELVTVKVNVKLPENTPEDKEITLNGLVLERYEEGMARGTFTVPRDSAFAFKLAIGDSFVNPCVEQDKNKKDIEYRRFKATDDMELNYVVENWKGL